MNIFCYGVPEGQPTTSSHQLRFASIERKRQERDHCPTYNRVGRSIRKKNMLINKSHSSSHVHGISPDYMHRLGHV